MLERPKIAVAGHLVITQSRIAPTQEEVAAMQKAILEQSPAGSDSHDLRQERLLTFDARDGTLLTDRELPAEEQRTGPLKTLPQPLTAADGTTATSMPVDGAELAQTPTALARAWRQKAGDIAMDFITSGDSHRGHGLVWIFGFSLVVLLVAVVILVSSATSARSSMRRFRFPEVGHAYLRYLVRSNLATVVAVLIAAGAATLLTQAMMALLGFQQPAIAGAVIVLVGALGFLATTNWTALSANQTLEHATRRAMQGLDLPPAAVFVGIFEPKKKSFFNQIVDTDDDIGFLHMEGDTLVFEGLRYRRQVARSAIIGLHRHIIWQFAYLGLQWLVIDYTTDEGPASLCVVCREEPSLRQCHVATTALHQRVETWQKGLA